MSEPREIVRYARFTDKTGRTWLVAPGPEWKNNIWVESDMGERGLGGSTERFRMFDGDDIVLIGPWNSNPDSFLGACDVRPEDVNYARL